MADNKVLIELQLIQKGDKLSIVQKDTEKLAKSQDKLNKSQKKVGKSSETVIKGQKGIHQGNLSSAKGFSKMNQMLDGGGGSSGLVAAYATLAANVFAASAAFNAFRGAAAFEQLGEGFTFMANQAGRTMDLIVDRLKEVSGEALSTEQALQGASLAISAGFSTDDLEKLTKVARGASLALGRNLSDAFDRLTRGAIKLEPEILDELGIMVRLDDATDAYAASIGKTSKQLTQFQRQQAFVNAINEQGIEKYGELADAIDVNPYDKLAASFSDLTHAGLGLLNIALIPIANLFAGNSAVMTGGLILFGSTILTTMIPALGNMAKSTAATAAHTLKLADAETAAIDSSIVNAKKDLGIGKKRTKTVKDLQRVIKEGGDVQKQALTTERNLKKQLARQNDILNNKSKKHSAAERKAAKARIIDINIEIKASKILQTQDQTRLGQAVIAEKARTSANQARIISESTANITQAGLIGGFKAAYLGSVLYAKGAVVATGATNKLAIAQSRLVGLLKTGTVAARLFGTALLTAIPVVGQAALTIGLLFTGIKALVGMFKEEIAGSKQLIAVTDTLDEKFEQLNTTINNLGASASKGDSRIRQIKMSAGVFLEVASGIEQITKAAEKAKNASLDDAFEAAGVKLPVLERIPGFMDAVIARAEGAKEETKRAAFGDLKEALQKIAKDETDASEFLREKMVEELNKSGLGTGGAPGLKITKVTKKNLKQAIENLSAGDFDKISEAIGNASKTTTDYNAALINLQRGLSENEQDFSKFFNTIAKTTKFDGIVKAFDALKQSAVDLSDEEDSLLSMFKSMGTQLRKFMTETEKESGDTGILAFIARMGEKGGLADTFHQLQADARTLTTDLKKMGIESKELEKSSKISGDGMIAFLDKQNEATQLRLTNAKAEALALESTTSKSGDLNEAIRRLKTEILGLETKILSTETIKLEGKKQELALERELLSITLKKDKAKDSQNKSGDRLRRMKITGSGDPLSTAGSERIKIKTARITLKAAKETARISRDELINQEKLLKSQLDKQVELKLIQQRDANELIAINLELNNIKRTGITETENAAKKSFDLVAVQGLGSNDPLAVAQAISALETKGGKAASAGLLITASLKGTINAFKELGAEGGALALALEKMLLFSSAMLKFKESVKELKETFDEISGKNGEDGKDLLASLGISNEKLAKGLVAMQALGSAISMIGSLAAANSAMAVAAIDRQIAAEKKLGGNSKASIAKLDAMEKKKTSIKKKAFEQDKKIKMASAMIAGLTGAVMAYAGAMVLGVPAGPIVGAILAGAIMALTAKNISMIASSQFDGGAAGSGGGAPQSIGVGSRSNSIDLSQGATGGELSYLRGNSGVGSSSSFKPGGASGMKRGYSTGGEILVGEQGPEIVQPTAEGYNVIPNDGMRGGGLNASITINAVDAAGVEEVLTAQRGNIISMIREAAHEHGEEFIEGVDTNAYAGGGNI